MFTYLPTSERESSLARTAELLLSRYIRKNQSLTVQVIDGDLTMPIELPAEAVTLLLAILDTMASGHGLTLIRDAAELTPAQAADVLQVSRPFLIKLLNEGQLPYRSVGRHRRIRLADVINYKRAIDEKREAILDQLVADAQCQAMGYN